MSILVDADTKVICKALARHTGDTGLYASGFAAHLTADWADSQLFRVTVALNFRPEALGVMMGQFSQAEAEAFAKDRAELSGDQPIASLTPQAAIAYLAHALAELESTVASSGAFMFGETPSIADFAVYHNLCFLKNNPVNAPLLAPWTGGDVREPPCEIPRPEDPFTALIGHPLRVIEAELVQDGSVNVMNIHFIFDGVKSEFICLSV